MDMLDLGIKAIAENTYQGLERVSFCAFTEQERSTVKAVVFGDNQ